MGPAITIRAPVALVDTPVSAGNAMLALETSGADASFTRSDLSVGGGSLGVDTAGGTLRLDASNLDASSADVDVALADGRAELVGGTSLGVAGGTLAVALAESTGTPGTAEFVLGPTASLNLSDAFGRFTLAPGATLRLEGDASLLDADLDVALGGGRALLSGALAVSGLNETGVTIGGGVLELAGGRVDASGAASSLAGAELEVTGTSAVTGAFLDPDALTVSVGASLDVDGGGVATATTALDGALTAGAGTPLDLGRLEMTADASLEAGDLVTSDATLAGAVTVAGTFTGAAVTLAGGTLTVPGAVRLGTAPDVPGAFTQNGGVVDSAGAFTVAGPVAVTGGTFRSAGTLAADGAIEVAGTGSTLELDGATVSPGAAALRLLDGGRLVGTGEVDGTLENVSGVVAPGFSPGILTVDAFTQSPEGTLAIEVLRNAAVAGEDYDQLKVLGTATLDGSLVFFDDAFEPPITDGAFAPLTYESVEGEFATVTSASGEALAFEVSFGPNGLEVTEAGPITTEDPAENDLNIEQETRKANEDPNELTAACDDDEPERPEAEPEDSHRVGCRSS